MKHTSWRVLAALAALGLSVSASRASAQAKTDRDKAGDREGRVEKVEVPKEYLPPAGMCRVWVDGVPAAQQPAPTDCASAVRNKPANGRVIYGEDKAKSGGKKMDELPVNRLKSSEKKGPPLIPPLASAPDGRAREAWEQKKITDEQLYGDRPANSSPASSYPGGAVSPQGPQSSQGGYITPGGVVVPGAVVDPRYFTQNPNVRPPGTGSSTCLDRDGDGWCDDLRYGPPVCTDTDRDGRCDDLPEFASRAYPQVLPQMRSALDVIDGRGSVEVMQWIGTNEFIVRVPEQGRGGAPWRAIFLDAQGELLQVWTDSNRDGRADRVEIFRNGQRTKLIQR
ncbi:MAG TPA: hypothetical protein DGD08_13325 [Gemmatimonas aurantiaca]|uniref:Uncharacterized protein n=2 Tax=Gemmatimonas aurantiaca TaxID=173480 RepID=C1AAL1_GEMAT|nr:hypothetical protein [Gemmatimonas aurantiaca]BAH39809.1 hypothetical protein GAU_2767 [Gemmatimonas aurantiaca T-27]HCT58180.1 hypothetical protein [Gemmatimonas aurantiaca]